MERVYENIDEVKANLKVVPTVKSRGRVSLNLYLEGKKVGYIDRRNNEVRVKVKMAAKGRLAATGREVYDKETGVYSDSIISQHVVLREMILAFNDQRVSNREQGGWIIESKGVYSMERCPAWFWRADKLTIDLPKFVPEGTIAKFHTHPPGVSTWPSKKDQEVLNVEKYNITSYIISRFGIYRYGGTGEEGDVFNFHRPIEF